MLYKKFGLGIIVNVVMISCSQQDQDFPKKDESYLPLQSGQFSEFDVEKTRYNADGKIVSNHYYVRQMLGDSFYQNNNQLTFPIKYEHQEPDQTWHPDSLSAIWRTETHTMSQEHGRTVIKISSPIYEGAHWDINTYNNTGKQFCEVTHHNKPRQIGGLHFPKTVTIIRQNDSTLLSLNKYIETYAQNVGLIKSERINLQYCYAAECVGKVIVSSGWKEVSIIQKFGKQ